MCEARGIEGKKCYRCDMATRRYLAPATYYNATLQVFQPFYKPGLTECNSKPMKKKTQNHAEFKSGTDPGVLRSPFPITRSFSLPSTTSQMDCPKEYKAKSCRPYFSTEVTFTAPMNNILHGYCLNRSHCIVFYTSVSCQEEARVNSPWTAR